MQPYRPPHLRQQAASGSSSSSNTAGTQTSASSLPSRTLNASTSSFVPRQQPSMRPGPVPSDVPGSRPRGSWTTARRGANLSSPASGIRPMRPDHPAAPPRPFEFSSSPRSSTPNGASPSRGSARIANGDDMDMEMMQSVSRSGGDGAEGDALKDWEVQERYRRYIDTRLDRHYSLFPTARDHAPLGTATEEVESLTSIVLLFRKLREGVVASHRIDGFAIEVFESSAKVAILANHRSQALASLSGLVTRLYRMYARASAADNGAEPRSARGDGLDEALASLSLRRDPQPNGHSASPERVHFASLLLLYHLVLSSPAVFRSIYEDLTLPSRPALNGHGDNGPPAAHSTGSDQPFVEISELDTVKRARKALSPDLFDPLKYWSLLADPRTSSYERAILVWTSGSVRERAWEMMKKVYMELGAARAGQMLGLEERAVARYAEEKGAMIENGRLKLR